MKKEIIILGAFIVIFSQNVFGWGKTGHRVIAEVAEEHLSDIAEERIEDLLRDVPLAAVANWMDDIKSDPNSDSLRSWHWVTIPKGMTYEETNINPDGDVIAGINYAVQKLKSGNLEKAEEIKYLKILIHLIGDLHQPLHVGNGKDLGGNRVDVKWFGKETNLHRVWDSQIINHKLYSYTELADIIDNPTSKQIKDWQKGSVEDWAQEMTQLRPLVYDIPEDGRLGYKYEYKVWGTIKQQLLIGGIRLAGILNEIYG